MTKIGIMSTVYNQRKSLLWSTILLVILLAENIAIVKGYPMIVEVEENSERCLRLNIPEDDDAHMVFLALPSPAYDEEEEKKTPKWVQNYNSLESHYLSQMQELTKRRTQTSALLRKFPVKPSSDVQLSMDDFLESFDGTLSSGCKVKLSNPKSSTSRNMDTYWFTPLVVNHVRRAIRTREQEREKSPLEGYEACFINDNDDFTVRIVVDSVLTSDGPDFDDDENESEDVNFQGHHLTPLSEQLGQSVIAAHTVINEMTLMERREQRMRMTADSINSRVRYFSYISVGILLVVTYLQVTYLKRYFRKKKLL